MLKLHDFKFFSNFRLRYIYILIILTKCRGNFMYAEVNCKGPGSDISNRVSWEKKIDPKLLYKYSTSYFINQDGWISKQPQ